MEIKKMKVCRCAYEQRTSTQGEEPVNRLFQLCTMMKNTIREMGGYVADEEID